MKFGRFSRLLAVAALALLLTGGIAVAKESKQPSDYPNATRSEPKNDLTSERDHKTLQAAIDANNAGDDAKVQENAQKILDSSKSKYAKGIALQLLANLKYNAGDYKGAVALYKQLLDLNSLPNDSYFGSMLNMVTAYAADEQYQQADEQMKVWREQGRSESPDSYYVEGTIDYHLQKFPEAIAAVNKAIALNGGASKDSWDNLLLVCYGETKQYDQMDKMVDEALAKDPTKTTKLNNALVVYQNNAEYARMGALMEKAAAKGALTTEDNYILMGQVFQVMAQNADSQAQAESYAAKGTQAVLDGIAKGVVKPGYKPYKLIGDTYRIAGNTAKAMEAYAKAAPDAPDGELDLLRAQVLIQDQLKYAEGKAALQQALKKGVKRQGAAYLLLGNAELKMKNNAAAIAAYKRAAEDSETASMARDMLKKLGAAK
ncbi:MAG: tetratricopeptide repeat protein [Mizugakiibacter sp.]|uniref:tetratricopeptide repeat protein n=1 Tax=Mizugakiibacter sp. TaxID=1972610 RepID=UPI0031BC7DA2|nr:tetratricopeptide repeat protein [Xanthomonadaceae bacterium]